ncbi:hypothetical protein QKT49_gp126 [Acanthamoeba castellanii medusavirus]|uniref:Uncharacterized protein n=1 Tax=Acanthamoeba castellanii medusavirus J1 TaxID=3114988 RepID=A0A3T1CWR2_9VIRU|nr:hypothetical protein QKT49_gp126 [Acanthamoeba castellanii medusavirus]BBI30266.1 hypothetical protein [Acanthamoeba castellanii medusavirus J1]
MPKKTLSSRDEAALAFLQRHNKNATSVEKIDQVRQAMLKYNLSLTDNVLSPRIQAHLDDL